MKAATIVIVLIGILVGLPSLAYPYGRDQGIFGVVANTILEGGLPYRDVFDFKPPGIFYTYAVIQSVFGSDAFALRLFDLIWQIATAILLGRLGQRLVSPFGGTVCGILYLFSYYALGFWHGAQPGGFLVLWVLGFMLLLGEPGDPLEDGDSGPIGGRRNWWIRAVLAGICLGTAVMFKYTVITALPLAMFRVDARTPALNTRRRFLQLLLAALGCCVVPTVWILYATGTGILDEFFAIGLDFTRAYVAASHGSLLQSVREFVLEAISCFGLSWWCSAGFVSAVLASRFSATLRERCLVPFLGLALLLTGVLAQGKYFAYQAIVLLPWFILLATVMLDFLFQTAAIRFSSNRLLLPAIAGIAVASVPLVASDWARLMRSDFARARGEWLAGFKTDDFRALDNELLTLYLRSTTRPEEPVFIWGFEPAIYLLSDRRCPTRFIYNLPQRAEYAADEWKRSLLEDLVADPPALIVVERDDRMRHILGNTRDSAEALNDFEELRSWLTRHYQPEGRQKRFVVYRRTTPADSESNAN